MQVISYPDRKDWKNILRRPELDISSLERAVSNIIQEIRVSGDEAVKKFTAMFDKVSVDDLLVSRKEIQEAEALVPADLKEAINRASSNIRSFHERQGAAPGNNRNHARG